MIKKFFQIFITAATLFSLNACIEDVDEDGNNAGNWIKQSDFEGVTRSGAISFKIGDYAYVGLGSDGDDYLTDFWRYDPQRNFWQEMAEFPGVGRIAAVSFEASGKGYVGTGYNANLETEELKDFWSYDPASDTWTQVADFAGSARYSAVSFALDGKGYVGTGFDGNYLKDFWAYDPSTDSWSQKISLFGSKRESAFAFTVNGIAYVGAGVNNGQYLYDFWAYDPQVDGWTDLSVDSDDDDNYEIFTEALNRYDAVTMVIDGVAYIATGFADAYLGTVYSYDPLTDTWEEGYTSFEGTARSAAVSFSFDSVGYITTGRSSSLRHDDIWSFSPNAEYDEYD